METNRSLFFPALLVACGVALAGLLIGRGFVEGRKADRFVTVKGVAERDVQADVALWPLRYVSTDDDLARAQSKVETSRKAILAFLEAHGIAPENAQLRSLEVEDRLAQAYQSGTVASRFTITQSMMVRSAEPSTILAASQAVGELVDAGVVLSASGGWAGGPTYVFTRLNDFKPEMIAEATASAREAAGKFAQDSGARLGPIRRASQGVFEILPRDRAPGVSEENQLEKTLRVVSTVEWFLE
jgi:hypothetical protein